MYYTRNFMFYTCYFIYYTRNFIYYTRNFMYNGRNILLDNITTVAIVIVLYFGLHRFYLLDHIFFSRMEGPPAYLFRPLTMIV